MLTIDQLKQSLPRLKSDKAVLYLDPLNQAMDSAEINTPLRISAFLANIAVESAELNIWVENPDYSAVQLTKFWPKLFPPDIATQYAHQPEKIANRAYANRMGNGDEKSGQGWLYRGRSPIQLTGKNNYRIYGDILGINLMSFPDLALVPENGLTIATAYWSKNHLNDPADAGDMKKICLIINGGYNGLNERLAYYNKIKKIFGI